MHMSRHPFEYSILCYNERLLRSRYWKRGLYVVYIDLFVYNICNRANMKRPKHASWDFCLFAYLWVSLGMCYVFVLQRLRVMYHTYTVVQYHTCYIYTHSWAFQVGSCLRLCWFCRPAWFQQNCCIPYEGETTVNNVLIRLLHTCFDIVALICVHRVMRSSVVYAMSMERGQAWWWSYQGTMKTRIMHHSEGSSSQGEGYPSLYAGWSWQGTIMDFHLNCILSLRLGEGLFTLTIGRRV